MPYLVLALENEVFLFATAPGIDILKIVQQFIRIYSVLIFINTPGPLRKALILSS